MGSTTPERWVYEGKAGAVEASPLDTLTDSNAIPPDRMRLLIARAPFANCFPLHLGIGEKALIILQQFQL